MAVLTANALTRLLFIVSGENTKDHRFFCAQHDLGAATLNRATHVIKMFGFTLNYSTERNNGIALPVQQQRGCQRNFNGPGHTGTDNLLSLEANLDAALNGAYFKRLGDFMIEAGGNYADFPIAMRFKRALHEHLVLHIEKRFGIH